jgi:HlyD family secretion protein
LNVDELDIKKVATGQSVTITAEASEGVVYSGVVTRVNISGTTVNGVTSYPS